MNRLFELTYILLNKKKTTAAELSEHFGVSQRTIYRDLDTLDLAGIPIYTEKGKGGGIGLLPEFVLNKSMLSDKEQKEILSALHAFSGVKATETDQVLKKLSTFFNKTTDNWLKVDFANWNNTDNNLFNDIKTAIFDKRIIKFDYYNSCQEKSSRRIEPYQLWFKSKAWYLLGYCLKKQDTRIFKLSRIKNLKITDKYFQLRDTSLIHKEPDSEKYKKITHFKLKISQEMTYRVYDDFDEKMIKKRKDGSFIVELNCPEDDWVFGFLLSFGEYIEVLEPAHARKIIMDKAKKIFKKY